MLPNIHKTGLSRDGRPIVQVVAGFRHDSGFGGGGMHVPVYEWLPLRDYLKLAYTVVPDNCRYQLPEDVPCTPSYRAEFNAWAKEFFGYTSVAPLETYVTIDERRCVSPATFQLLYEGHLEQFNRAHGAGRKS